MKNLALLAFLVCGLNTLVSGQYTLTVTSQPAVSAPGLVYRFYVNMEDPTDRLSAVFGNNQASLIISTPEGAFNSTINASWNASGVNPAFLTAYPELADDSFATIGLIGPASESNILGAADPSIVEDDNQPITPYFLTPGATNLQSTSWTGASWYVLNTAGNALPDANLQVLIMQLTTTGDISGQINYQIFPLGVGANQQQISVSFDGAGTYSECGEITPVEELGNFEFVITSGGYPTEIGWKITETPADSTAVGVSVFSTGDETLACTGSTPSGGGGDGEYNLQLTCGSQYTLQTWDTFGDGWNGGELSITNANGVTLLNTPGPEDGCFGSVDFVAHCPNNQNCNDENACNFCPFATSSYGCNYDCYGCTDPLASNYDENATLDYSILGSSMCVYCEDESSFPISLQLTAPTFLEGENFNDVYFHLGMDSAQGSIQTLQGATISPQISEFYGCLTYGCHTIETNLSDEQTTELHAAKIIINQNDTLFWNKAFGMNNQPLCITEEGCTDSNAVNYQAWHSIDNGSCQYRQIELFLPSEKYELTSSVPTWRLENENGSVLESGDVLFFKNPNEISHIPLPDSGVFRVRIDHIDIFDWECTAWELRNQYDEVFDETPGRWWDQEAHFNYSNWFEMGPGCMDDSAPNYSWGATTDDGSCFHGCTDPSACNYSEWAVEDDGSCAYEDMHLQVIPVANDPPFSETPTRFWWSLSGQEFFETFYNNQWSGYPCDEQQLSYSNCYHSGCYDFDCSHGNNGVEISNHGEIVHQIEPVNSDFSWDNEETICLLRPLEICHVSINDGQNCVIHWDPLDAAPITQAVRIYRQSNITSEYEFIGQTSMEDGAFVDTESSPGISPYSYKITRKIWGNDESNLSDSHKTIHLAANLGVNNSVNLSWNNYEGVEYANFRLQRLQPGSSEWETFATVSNTTNSYTDTNPLSVESDYQVVVELAACSPLESSKLAVVNSNIISLVASSIGSIQEENESHQLIWRSGLLSLESLSDKPINIVLTNSKGQMIWHGEMSHGDVISSASVFTQNILFASFLRDGILVKTQKITPRL